MIVVVVIAIAAIVGYLLLGGGGDSNTTAGDLKEGDYLKYADVTTSGDTVLNYVYWLNVTDVSSTSYSIKMTTFFNGHWYMEHNWTVNKDKVYTLIAIIPTDRIEMGQTTIDTAFGSRQVEHYQANHLGEVMDFYVGDNGVLYRYTFTLGGTHGEYNLVDISPSLKNWV